MLTLCARTLPIDCELSPPHVHPCRSCLEVIGIRYHRAFAKKIKTLRSVSVPRFRQHTRMPSVGLPRKMLVPLPSRCLVSTSIFSVGLPPRKYMFRFHPKVFLLQYPYDFRCGSAKNMLHFRPEVYRYLLVFRRDSVTIS